MESAQLILPPWYGKALEDLNVAEIPGTQNHPRIIQAHAITKGKAQDDETAWCAAILCLWLEESGFTSPRSAWARDFLNWGEECSPDKLGAILVFARGSGGHATVNAGKMKDFHWGLGGNQGNKVCFEKFLTANLLGARWPKQEELNADAK
jgi:uncharacterized protein (TIGR02594 family)